MRMVTAPRGPRPFLLHLQLLLQYIIVVFVCTSTTAFAQDRVILFEPFVLSANNTFLPGEIRELQISQGGRAWSVVRSVPLPPHSGGSPVALADGSRIVWLAFSGNSKLLVQYDATTARASIVDIGVFDPDAFLVSDPVTPRVYIIEPRRVTFIDYRLQPARIELSGTRINLFAQATGSHLILHRRSATEPDEVVVIDPQTAATINVIPLDEFSTVRASRNGRLYRHYSTFPPFERWIEARLLSTGALITRTLGRAFNFFELDDSRGVLVHDQQEIPSGRWQIIVRDAATLAVIGELAPGVFDSRRNFSLSQTASRTILMSSREILPSYLDSCSSARVDIFDATTFALVNRINLQGRCPSVVPLPSR